MKYIILAILIVAIFMAARYAMPNLGESSAAGIKERNDQSYLGDCPTTPNCRSSEASQDSHRVNRLNNINDPDEAIGNLARVIESLDNMTVVQFDERYLHATDTTPVMRYVDDVEFLLSDDRQSIQIRSASRLGKSDLGANAQRIERIRAAANGKL